MSEQSCWKFLLKTWAISLRVQTQFSAILEQQIIKKMSKNGFHSKHLCKYIVTFTYLHYGVPFVKFWYMPVITAYYIMTHSNAKV